MTLVFEKINIILFFVIFIIFKIISCRWRQAARRSARRALGLSREKRAPKWKNRELEILGEIVLLRIL